MIYQGRYTLSPMIVTNWFQEVISPELIAVAVFLLGVLLFQ